MRRFVLLRINNNKLNITIMKYFCTYKNSATNGIWTKSKEYDTMKALLDSMLPYLEQHPTTTVQYQFVR